MQTKGIPDCINVAKFAESRVKVIGYNETLQGMKMKSLFYFIDEKFVMGEFVFSDLIKVKPAKITGILSTKYLDGTELTSDSIYITDPKTTILYYENNGFSICMRYFFAGDTQVNETLASVYSIGGDSAENYIRALHNEEMLNRF
jgi:hypothetical protein